MTRHNNFGGVAFCLLLSSVYAQYPPNEFCYRSCELALANSVVFNATDSLTGRDCPSLSCRCVNALSVTSLYLCNKTYCTQDEIYQGMRSFNESCRTFANVTAPDFQEVVSKYSHEDIQRMRHISKNEAIAWPGPWPTVSEVVIVDLDFYKLAHDTMDAAYFELRTHWIYGLSMYLFWIAVITIGIISHFARFLAEQEQKWERIPDNDPAALEVSQMRKENIFKTPYTLLKRYVTVPATFGYTRAQNISWWATIPTRAQSIIICVFIILNIDLCSISYHLVYGNLYWFEESTQLLRYIADRTGIISTANLALIWVFAVRNNVFLWLTGWDFATYNNFHRWVGRVATVQAIVHSVAYTILICQNHASWYETWDAFAAYMVQKYFWNGVLATIFMSLICVFSIYGVRRNFYEIFLILHILLSIGVLVTMWYHVEIFNGAYNWFLYPCFGIWILDRLVRCIRFLLFNIWFWKSKATITYSHKSNIIRLTVPYSSSLVNPRPGTFYYISSLNLSNFWESHPFTLSYSTSLPAQNESELSFQPSHGTISPPRGFPSPSLTAADSEHSQNPTTPASTNYESETLLKSNDNLPSPGTLTFLIRPYSGFTSRLRASAVDRPASQCVLLDGPYGETQPLHKYENVLFIVGGAGIAVPLSYLTFLLSSSSKVETVKIIWAVREEELLRETIAIDFRGMLADGRFELVAFITGHDVTSESNSEEVSDMAMQLKGVRVRRGRPNMRQEIIDLAGETGRHSEIAVMACGPAKMADDSRATVVELLGNGWGKIEYFEESFNW